MNKLIHNDRAIQKIMSIKCSICRIEFYDIKSAFNHNSIYHYQELRTSRYSITSCLNCDFRHSNASVVKLHCEITHPCCIGIKYISHHRFMSKSKSIQQFHIKNNEHLNLPELYERLRMVFRKWARIISDQKVKTGQIVIPVKI